MVKIKILPENLANKIAAGEVVERPASVVKELVENSIDAGASRIFVDVATGGTKLISVSDDGCGMGPDDALLSLERHATSKISSAEDLSSITTLGFRGEAIPSIASVSRTRITTSTGDGPGAIILLEGGRLVSAKEVGAPRGAIIEVRDLFFNTPARLKFLKSRETELSHIAASVQKAALAFPAVHFRLTSDGKAIIDCPKVASMRDRVGQLYGHDFADGLIAVDFARDGFVVTGFVSAPGVSFSDKTRQEVFLNGRPVRNQVITRAVYDACQSLVMKDRHPAVMLFIAMDPASVDVNVHPAKREVRFSDNGSVHRAVYDALTTAFRQTPLERAEAREEQIEGVRETAVEYSPSETGSDRFFRHSFTPPMPRQETMALPRPKPYTPQQMPQEITPQRQWERPNLMQVLDSYIIVPEADGYMVIDQHAAHERVQYERIKARHGSAQGSQGFLVPERLDLSAKEAALLEGILPELNNMGLEVEHFGGTSFLIRSKPIFMEKVDVKEAVTGILSEMEESDIKGGVESLREKVYQLMACKSAVKAGQRLHPEAMARLVQQLFDCEMPQTCAHGRPTVVKYSLNDIEKLFKRK